MNENDNPGRREHFIELFMKSLEKCPHVIKADIGAKSFASEIIEGTKMLYATHLN
jgi:hypothetical protein